MENETQNTQEEVQEQIQEQIQEVAQEVVETATAVTEEAPQDLLGKLQAMLPFKMPKKALLGVIAVVGVAIVALVATLAINIATNTYKTPLKLMEKLEDRKAGNIVDDTLDQLNGFSEKEFRAVLKATKKSEDIKDALEEAQEDYEESIEELQELYGKKYSVKYKVESKEKLDKDDLKDVRSEFKTMAKSWKSLVDRCEDFDSDEWEDMADEMGMSKADAKKFVKAIDALYNEWKDVKVSAGYELEVVKTIKYSEDGELAEDEMEEIEMTIYVYKVNGRWVSSDVMFMDIDFS